MKIKVIKTIYWMNLTIMKKVLSLYEYKVGKDTDEYRYFKKEVMSYFYDNLKKFYNDLVKEGYSQRCECSANLRQGYKDCEKCGGCGFHEKE